MPCLGRARGELLEQACADPAALQLVRDGERRPPPRSGRAGARTRDRDDALVAAPSRARRRARRARPSRDRGSARRASSSIVRMPVEAQVAALLGEPVEERDEGVRVVLRGRPQPERAAVAEDDVDRAGRRRGYALTPTSASSPCFSASSLDGRRLRARPSARASRPPRRTCRTPPSSRRAGSDASRTASRRAGPPRSASAASAS